MRRAASIALLALAAACGGGSGADAGFDAGFDADPGDAGVDGAPDAGSDAGGCDAAGGPCIPADLAVHAGSAFDTRIDCDGDGRWESYWTTAVDPAAISCVVERHARDRGTLLFRSTIPSCDDLLAPTFHFRSFMGDSTCDFTVLFRDPASTATLPWYLSAGDGATGVLRDIRLFFGDAAGDSILRTHGIATVDYGIAGHPGPALLVRTTGQGRARLFAFPGASGHVDLSSGAAWGWPFAWTTFAGVDRTGSAAPDDPACDPSTASCGYSAIYDAFNFDLRRCAPIVEAGLACGVPDPAPDASSGYFLDKLAVGDIDADGLEDALTVHLWRSTVYPARPKGGAMWLGAPQLDVYYNPQDDGTACHSGRHYGLSALVNVDDDPHLETIDIAGTPVAHFANPYQNVSRNVAMIDARPDPALPATLRELRWNLPFRTSIGTTPSFAMCNPDTRLFEGAIHYPGDGMIRAGGRVRYVHVNVWNQTSMAAVRCPHGDGDCYFTQLRTQTGRWAWRAIDARTGATALEIPGIYAWDVIEERDGTTWLVYSGDADAWNVGYERLVLWDTHSPDLLRDDLRVARLDLSGAAPVVRDETTLGTGVAPWLVNGRWQARSGAVADNWDAFRLFVDHEPTRFVLRTAAGLAWVVRDGSGWRLLPAGAPAL